MAITWTTERRKLRELNPWPRNPRQIRGEQAKRLAESVDTFGQVETLAVGPDNELYNGHQRLNVLAEQYGPDYEVDVRVASRTLSEKEREKLTVFLHKGAAGEWDFDVLANEFEIDELLDWGFKSFELGLENDIDPFEEWKGMPKFESEDLTPVKTLLVHFRSMDDLQAFAQLIGQPLTEKTKSIWIPEMLRENLMDKVWSSDD